MIDAEFSYFKSHTLRIASALHQKIRCRKGVILLTEKLKTQQSASAAFVRSNANWAKPTPYTAEEQE